MQDHIYIVTVANAEPEQDGKVIDGYIRAQHKTRDFMLRNDEWEYRRYPDARPDEKLPERTGKIYTFGKHGTYQAP